MTHCEGCNTHFLSHQLLYKTTSSHLLTSLLRERKKPLEKKHDVMKRCLRFFRRRGVWCLLSLIGFPILLITEVSERDPVLHLTIRRTTRDDMGGTETDRELLVSVSPWDGHVVKLLTCHPGYNDLRVNLLGFLGLKWTSNAPLRAELWHGHCDNQRTAKGTCPTAPSVHFSTHHRRYFDFVYGASCKTSMCSNQQLLSYQCRLITAELMSIDLWYKLWAFRLRITPAAKYTHYWDKGKEWVRVCLRSQHCMPCLSTRYWAVQTRNPPPGGRWGVPVDQLV